MKGSPFMIELVAVKLDFLMEWDLTERLLPFLSTDKQRSVKAYRRREDAQRCLIADLLVRLTLMRKLGCANGELRFTTNRYGKPQLEQPGSWHYNISHSGSWVVLAVDSETVGIDVEQILPLDMDIAQRFFAAAEMDDLLREPEQSRLSYFYDLWTLKESYMKADGRGLSLPLHSYAIQKVDGQFRVFTYNRLTGCSFRQYDIDPHYKVSVCAVNDCFPEYITIWSNESLVKMFLDTDRRL